MADGASSSALAAASESWASFIPAVFSLAPDEVTTLEAPQRYYFCLPRQALLPFVTAPVQVHFLPFAPPMGRGEVWFEYASEPLLWQIPIGALWSYLARAGISAPSSDAGWLVRS